MRSLMDSKSIRRFKREVKVHQFINTSYMALITLVFVLINLALYTLVAWAAWLVVVVNHFGGTPLTTPESIILGVAVMLTFGRYVSGEKAKGIFLFWRVRSLQKAIKAKSGTMLSDHEHLLQMLHRFDLE